MSSMYFANLKINGITSMTRRLGIVFAYTFKKSEAWFFFIYVLSSMEGKLLYKFPNMPCSFMHICQTMCSVRDLFK